MFIRSQVVGKGLDRNGSIQLRIQREVNFTHAALTELGANFVATESSSRRDRHQLKGAAQFVTTLIKNTPSKSMTLLAGFVPGSARTITDIFMAMRMALEQVVEKLTEPGGRYVICGVWRCGSFLSPSPKDRKQAEATCPVQNTF